MKYKEDGKRVGMNCELRKGGGRKHRRKHTKRQNDTLVHDATPGPEEGKQLPEDRENLDYWYVNDSPGPAP